MSLLFTITSCVGISQCYYVEFTCSCGAVMKSYVNANRTIENIELDVEQHMCDECVNDTYYKDWD